MKKIVCLFVTVFVLLSCVACAASAPNEDMSGMDGNIFPSYSDGKGDTLKPQIAPSGSAAGDKYDSLENLRQPEAEAVPDAPQEVPADPIPSVRMDTPAMLIISSRL